MAVHVSAVFGPRSRLLTRDDSTGFAPPPAFGPYRVLHQIGVGALGPVFRTYEPTRDRLVAIKVFRLDVTPEAARALADELGRAAAVGLFHPSIVEPVDAGLEGTVAYRAEEYVAAESLDVAMRHYAPATLDKVLPFITQLAAAIDFARVVGVGHGALHPRDIFVTPDEARATGFGVVDALERQGLRAPVRRPYSPPERIAGEPWGTAADVFSLAVIAFELLTGRRPTGLGEEMGSLSGAALGDRGEEVRAVLARAMSERPSDRYATAAAFASALAVAAGTQATAAAAEDVTTVAGVATASDLDLSAGMASSADMDPSADVATTAEEALPATDASLEDFAAEAAPLSLEDSPRELARKMIAARDVKKRQSKKKVVDEPEPIEPVAAELAADAAAVIPPAEAGPLMLAAGAVPVESALVVERVDTPSPVLDDFPLAPRAESGEGLTELPIKGDREPALAPDLAEADAAIARLEKKLEEKREEKKLEKHEKKDRKLHAKPLIFEPEPPAAAEPAASEPPKKADFVPVIAAAPEFPNEAVPHEAIANEAVATESKEAKEDIATEPEPETDVRKDKEVAALGVEPEPLVATPSLVAVPAALEAVELEPSRELRDVTDRIVAVDEFKAREAAAPKADKGDRMWRVERTQRTVPPKSGGHRPIEPDSPASDTAPLLLNELTPGEPTAERDRFTMLPVAMALGLGMVLAYPVGYIVGRREAPTATVEQTAAPRVATPPANGTTGTASSDHVVPGNAPVATAPTTSAPTTSGPAAVPPPAPSKPSPVATTGRLMVTSDPPRAAVTINKKWSGRTPLTIDGLAFGKYEVRVVEKGYQVSRQVVTLSAGTASRSMDVRLRPDAAARKTPAATAKPSQPPAAQKSSAATTGEIYVASRPTGARVFVNDKEVGVTPLTLRNQPAGTYQVRLELADHQAWRYTARVVGGETARVTGSLEQIR